MARAYLSPDGTLTVDVAVVTDGGIPRAALGGAFDGFRSAVEQLGAWSDDGTDGDSRAPAAPAAPDATDDDKPNAVI